MCKMCGTCSSISSVLILVAGLSMIGASMGALSGSLSWMVSGALLALYGIGGLVHSMNLCPMCNKK